MTTPNVHRVPLQRWLAEHVHGHKISLRHDSQWSAACLLLDGPLCLHRCTPLQQEVPAARQSGKPSTAHCGRGEPCPPSPDSLAEHHLGSTKAPT